ncbi:acyltransferase family protein [Azospirillum sp.]|uniref:acyltransferase family protein n=1 Tax=Azospirillum sp. TaxID=34012 RepID=UPI003D720692
MAQHRAGIPGVEGLRGVAAASVSVYHVWLYGAPDGSRASFGPVDTLLWNLQAGVALFFALSGFLLYRPFARAILRNEALPGVRIYLIRRALRILPAYWVVLLLVAVVLEVARTDIATMSVGSLATRPGVLLANMALVQNYSPATALTGIGPAWSLAVEAVFYLALPVLATLAWRRSGAGQGRAARLRTALLPAGLLLLTGLIGKAVAVALARQGVLSGDPWDGSWYAVLALGFWCHADLFTWGMAVAVLHVGMEDDRFGVPAAWPRWAAIGLAGLGAALALLAVRYPVGGKPVFDVLLGPACGVLLGLIVLPRAAERPRSWLARALEWRPVAALGVISYSLFLWNEPVTLWLARHGLSWNGRAGFLANLALVAAVAGAAATATYLGIERPALRAGHASRRSAPSGPLPTADGPKAVGVRNGGVSTMAVLMAATAVSGLILVTAAAHAAGRDRPFRADSPWNTPIPPTAARTPVPGLAALPVGLSSWLDPDASSIPIFTAAATDPLVRVLHNDRTWVMVANGAWRHTGNGAATEAEIRRTATPVFPPHHPYVSQSAERLKLPVRFDKVTVPRGGQFVRAPRGVHPSLNADGHMVVRQPDGRMLETFATVVLSDGTIVCQTFKITDPGGMGDGRQNGVTASMIPVYAGLIRRAEFRAGAIEHAVKIVVPAGLLDTAFVYPALAFDRGARTEQPPYSGTLPMGARLALPADADLERLGLTTAFGRLLARTASSYGFIVVDRGGAGVTLMVEYGPHDPALDRWDQGHSEDLARIFANLSRVEPPSPNGGLPHP